MSDQKTVALVTGASRGIGRTIARTYCSQGMQVMGCARSETELESVSVECEPLPGEFQGVAGDLTNSGDRETIVERLIDVHGQVDVLVNNAGALGTRDPISEYPDNVWEYVIDINLNAVFHLTKLALKPMLVRGSGRIINITSGVGVHGSARWGAYAVSKFGVEGLTQVLADEVRDTGIEVNAVNPGPTSTTMRAAAYPDEDPETIASPEDVMDVFVFLASSSARGNNGIRYEAQEFVRPTES